MTKNAPLPFVLSWPAQFNRYSSHDLDINCLELQQAYESKIYYTYVLGFATSRVKACNEEKYFVLWDKSQEQVNSKIFFQLMNVIRERTQVCACHITTVNQNS